MPLITPDFYIIFQKKNPLLRKLKIRGIRVQDLGFMPAVAIQLPMNSSLIEQIANFDAAAQISLHRGAEAELDITIQALKLAPSPFILM